MANVFSSNPIYIDTDTTVVGNTNWRGTSGGSQFVGKIGLRPEKIIVTPLGATTALAVHDLKMCWGDSYTKIDSVRRICADCGKRR
jgi:hypothetical protein